MQAETIFYIIISIVIVGYVFEQILDYLNLKSQRSDIPEEMKDFYDQEKYEKSLRYHKTQGKFSFISSAFSFIIMLAMLWFGGFGILDAFLRLHIQDEIILALAFFGSLVIASDILTIPFQLYSIFIIEEKFGFNRMTVKTFISDKVKSYLLGAILGGSLLYLLLFLVGYFGDAFWYIFWLAIALFMLVMNMFYTSLILPLFNKLSPLPEGELKTAIENFSRSINFPVTNIYVIDGSKRSSKSNAFFSGLGRQKKIVLYDTLIKNHSTEELVAILAHEAGHYKKKHIFWSMIISLVQSGLVLYILSLFIFNEQMSFAMGAGKLGIHLNLLAFTILYSPVSSVLGLIMNMYSRKNEFEADAYARQTYKAEPLIQALKKLSVDNLSNLYPHPLYVFVNYSHPPLLLRLRALQSGLA
ncbi:MAG TPA: M48 family metallopeptidase [Cyclobacteriaceae bacterium]|nr:M48 family metallopeptidase [Cyclobacteriaceae bacterium]